MAQLTKNFSLEEMTVTNSGLPNVPNAEQLHFLQLLCEQVLQPIRDAYGKPIKVNSGFRSTEVNRSSHGVENSQHLKGQAADITCENNKELFDFIVKNKFVVDQIIDEKNYRWIHISFCPNANRNQILHIK